MHIVIKISTNANQNCLSAVGLYIYIYIYIYMCVCVCVCVLSKSGIISGCRLSLTPLWWPGLKNSPTVTHACRKRRLKWVPNAWGYSWATLSPGVINTGAWSSRFGVGRWTNNPAL
jgi:hypothetical protein